MRYLLQGSRATPTAAVLALGLALAAAAPLSAEELFVVIEQPAAGEPVFGEVTFAAAVEPLAAVARVELLVDGREVAELLEPPFLVRVDVGHENLQHRFEVRAHGRDGEVAEAFLVSPQVRQDLTVDAELQQLYVTVTRGDERVLDLVEEDFAVIDQGARQELVTFARGDIPLAALLLIDSSASMRGDRLRHALRGAAAFTSLLRPEDDAAVYLFSDRLLVTSPFSSDPEVIYAGLGELRGEGGTALNDNLYLALKRLEERQGRRVVILLSDGIDSHSVLRAENVRWLARRSRAMIYWIRTVPADEATKARYSSWKDADTYRKEYEELVTLVRESGGRIVDLDALENADAAFADLLRELREQYVLGYYPSNSRNDGTWHRVHVRLEPGGLRVRTRDGYIDY